MRLIDTFPTNKIKEFEYRRGRMLPFGATLQQDGMYQVGNFPSWGRCAGKLVPRRVKRIIYR